MKEEIVLRRNIYNGKAHKLVYTGTGDAWRFSPAESWMPVYLSYDDNGTIISLDSDGFGHPACIGDTIDGYRIEAIVESDDEFLMFLKEV